MKTDPEQYSISWMIFAATLTPASLHLNPVRRMMASGPHLRAAARNLHDNSIGMAQLIDRGMNDVICTLSACLEETRSAVRWSDMVVGDTLMIELFEPAKGELDGQALPMTATDVGGHGLD